MRAKRPGPARSLPALRLRAEDAEDLAVISACLQDALVSVGDLAYDRATRTFIAVANRFRWEGRGVDQENDMPFERTLCAIEVEGVDAAVYRGFERNEAGRILSLLAIQPASTAGGSVTIDLEFAGAATIRLSAAAISCRAHDFGEPWPTSRQPGHEVDPPP